MRRKRKYLILGTVLFLAVAFATVTTTLVMRGGVMIAENTDDYAIYFSKSVINSEDVSKKTISTNGQTLTFDAEMKEVGESTKLDYEVTNASKNYDAKVTIDCSLDEIGDKPTGIDVNQYLNIEYSNLEDIIPARNTGNGSITITLKRSMVEDMKLALNCSLRFDGAEKDTLGVTPSDTITSDYSFNGYLLNSEGELLPNTNIVILDNPKKYISTDNESNFTIDDIDMGFHDIYILEGKTLEEIKKMDNDEIKSNATANATFTQSSQEIIFDNGYKIANELTKKEITITFNPQGGKISIKNKTVLYGDTYGELPTPTLNGYNFIGWYTNTEYTTPVNSSEKVKIENDITLYAKWETKEYKVAFNTDGGDTIEEKLVKYNSTYGDLPTPTKEGYTFLGWYLGETQITNASKFTSLNDVTLKAKWEVKKTTVTVQVNGIPTEVEIETNKPITEILPNPSKDGYDFEGWYLDEECTTPVTEDTKIPDDGNITFYPKYESKTYVVSFDPNGGSVTTSSKEVTYDKQYGDLPTPTKNGYNFVGWFTAKTDGTQITSSSTVSITSEQTLYARWSAKTDITYTVKHWKQKLNSSENPKNETNYELVDTENLKGTANASVTPNTKTYNGFTAPSKESITVKEDGSAVVNYYYTRNTYTLTVKKDDGVQSANSKSSYKFEEEVNITYTIKEGYTFKNITGDKISNNFTMPASNTTITVNTTENIYTITYHSIYEGALTSNNPTSYKVTSDDITLSNPNKTGYTFTGWTGSNGATPEKNATIPKGSIGDKVYIANFNPNTYTVSFDANGGNEVETVFTVTYDETYGETFPTPTREGYTFAGWYTEAINGSEVTSTTKVALTDNQTLYAHWTLKSYTLTIIANNGGSVSHSSVPITYEGTNTFTVTPNDEYYLAGLSCTNGYTTNAKTDLSQTGVQTVTISNNGQNASSTCTARFKDTSNAAAPVIDETNKLVPVTLANDGTVTKVSEDDESWYNYNEKKWANAVILYDEVPQTYNVGDVIPEDDIESYFVWIPKYKYRLWNVDTMKTSDVSPVHQIDIIFDTKDTTDIEGSSCKTPLVSGESGNCDNGEYMTHPAFITFGVDGFWVGKFETGYKGATSKSAAQVYSSDSSKIIIKPNVYSWRDNTVYNFFTSAYNYERSLDSHMMKNTEWGAVAYLSHSKYGIGTEVNINNNSSSKTGYSALPTIDQSASSGTYGDGASYNQAYNTEVGYLASTTGNITGVYDMSGGNLEYMASYRSATLGSSGFSTTELANYNAKYFDVYNASSTSSTYKYRILGDATGEMSPVSNRQNSWYADESRFVESTNPWFNRGSSYTSGVLAGQFNFNGYSGGGYTYIGSRLVLSPQ